MEVTKCNHCGQVIPVHQVCETKFITDEKGKLVGTEVYHILCPKYRKEDEKK